MRRLGDDGQNVRAPLRAMPRGAEVPLSFAQRRLWFLNRLEGPSATYTIPLAVRLAGDLDVAALELALGDLMARHESLRTVFPETLGVPRQQVLEVSAAPAKAAAWRRSPRTICPRLCGSPPKKASTCRASRRCGRICSHSISSASRTRAHPASLPGTSPSTCCCCCCITSRATAPRWRRWRAISPTPMRRVWPGRCRPTGARCRRCRCSMPTTRSGSTRCWARRAIRESAIARQLGFWTQTLADLPEAIALPADRPRPRVASYRGGRVPLRLPADLHASLLTLARQNGASLFMVLQAGLAALLTRLGAAHDIPIGSPVAGRGDHCARRPGGVLRQHPGAAHRHRRAIRASSTSWRGCVPATFWPTATRSCHLNDWWKSSTRRARCRITRCSR